jgi:outer membrane protein TolC
VPPAAIVRIGIDQVGGAVNEFRARYTQGLTNFLDVLDAQRSLSTAEDSLVQSTAALDIDLVSLYKALGGGWERNDLVTR